MRTVTFKSVLHGVARRLGLDPDVNLLENQAATLTEYINEEFREVWEKFDHPEFCPIEERAYRDEYDNAVTYAVGDEVYYATTGLYYVCLLISLAHLPTNETYWEEQTELDKYIAYEQTGKTKLGDVFKIWTHDPRVSRTYPEVGKWPSENGWQVEVTAPATVFIFFRRRPPEFSSTSWDAAEANVVDDVRYYATTGECYLCIQAGTNKNPATQTAYWTKIDFPFVLAPYVKLAAHADALQEDEQWEKAGPARARANERFLDELDKVILQSQQYGSYKVLRGN